MKIAILIPVIRGFSGGILTYLNAIIPRIQLYTEVTKLSIVVPQIFAKDFCHLEVDIHTVSPFDYLFGFRGMGKFVSSNSFDIALSLTARKINNITCPIVTMAQNVEPFHKPSYPTPFFYKLRLTLLKKEYTIACQQASFIIAVSNYMKTVLRQSIEIPDGKVEVIYNGYDANDHRKPKKPNHPIPELFFFSSGSFSWYRGFEDIVQATAVIKSKHGKAPIIAISGQNSYGVYAYKKKLDKLIKSMDVVENILWLGQLDQNEMTWCYQNSIAFIQTSRVESFSNTQVEAMGISKLCISSDYPLMKEIFKNNAIFYSAGDYRTLAQAMIFASGNSSKKDSTKKKKMNDRALKYSWDVTADKTLKLLRSAILSNNGNTSVT